MVDPQMAFRVVLWKQMCSVVIYHIGGVRQIMKKRSRENA